MSFRNAIFVILAASFSTWAGAETVAHVQAKDPSWDPKDSDVHMAYEWSTFDPAAPAAHAPGAVLSAPGDSYSYTVLRSDEYANNPNYEIVKAIVGVHIDDSNSNRPDKKWGRIEINGKALPFITNKKDKRESVPTDLVEIISDATLTGKPGSSVPPYIFDVQRQLQSGQDIRVTITNLRQDGALDSDARFGGFVVNRIGAHVWYRERR